MTDMVALKAAVTQLLADANALNAAIGTPPPVTSMASPDGTRITRSSGTALTDAAGAKWTMTADGTIMINGVMEQNKWQGKVLEVFGGAIWLSGQDAPAAGSWYKYVSGAWVQQAGVPA